MLTFSDEYFLASIGRFGDLNTYTSDANEPTPSEEFDDGGLDVVLQVVVNYTSTSPSKYIIDVRTVRVSINKRPITYMLAQYVGGGAMN